MARAEVITLCRYCTKNKDGRHEADCPQPVMNKKLFVQAEHDRQMPCPAKDCEGFVGINGDDLYECRACHTRWSGDFDTDKTGVMATFNDKGYHRFAYLMNAKGDGNFPMDRELAALDSEIERKLKGRPGE